MRATWPGQPWLSEDVHQRTRQRSVHPRQGPFRDGTLIIPRSPALRPRPLPRRRYGDGGRNAKGVELVSQLQDHAFRVFLPMRDARECGTLLPFDGSPMVLLHAAQKWSRPAWADAAYAQQLSKSCFSCGGEPEQGQRVFTHVRVYEQ